MEPLKREIVITEDGSHTLIIPELNEQYHSMHGAIQESEHIYLKHGFLPIDKDVINVLEIGFGTGLNALLTYCLAKSKDKKVFFHSIEKYPLNSSEYKLLNYTNNIDNCEPHVLLSMHQANWNEEIEINKLFYLKKIQDDLINLTFNTAYDLVYFDAFAPSIQPNLWELDIFQKIYDSMSSGGVLTTYCAKGQVRRNMQSVGFVVERLPGPPGKREFLRATKPKAKGSCQCIQ